MATVELVPPIQWNPDVRRGKVPKPSPWQMDFATPEGDWVRVQWLLVTPELAERVLDANDHNRKISPGTQEQYRRALADGTFLFAGDTIVISDDGRVLDGQHRLMAIVESGEGLWCMVVGGLPMEVQRHKDIGRGRSTADQLGIDKFSKPGVLSAAGKLLLEWEGWRQGMAKPSPGKAEITAWVHKHRSPLETGADFAVKIHKALNRGISMPALVAAYVRAQQVMGSPFPGAEFMTLLITGDGLVTGMPMHSLRQTIIRSDRAERDLNLYWLVRTWNALRAKEPLTTRQLPVTKQRVTASKMPDMYPDGRNPGGQQSMNLDTEE